MSGGTGGAADACHAKGSPCRCRTLITSAEHSPSTAGTRVAPPLPAASAPGIQPNQQGGVWGRFEQTPPEVKFN